MRSFTAFLLIASIPVAACHEATAPAANQTVRGDVQALMSPAGEYEIIDLGTLPGFVESHARGINDADQVVGYSVTSTGVQHAFLWQNGVMTDLGNLGGSPELSAAFGINNLGQIVGWSLNSTGGLHAFLWQTGAFTDLGSIAGPYYASQAFDINDDGQIVGWSMVGETNLTQHAAMWQNGSWTDLTPNASTCGAEARAINELGQVAGYQVFGCTGTRYGTGFFWSSGALTDIPTLGGLGSWAYGINDAGDVVGISTLSVLQTPHAFLWQDGTLTDLAAATGNPLDVPTHAYDVANDGNVVGTGSHGPFALIDGTLLDLGTLGGAEGTAWRMNEIGNIVGESQTALGQYHATLWRRPFVPVGVMIEPSEDPNSINTTQQGRIPVAILSTADFDAPAQVDHQSLTFGRTGDEPSLASCARSGEDVNGDGLPDLVCQFYAQETDLEVGDTEGIVKGRTVDGRTIKGQDSVRIVK